MKSCDNVFITTFFIAILPRILTALIGLSTTLLSISLTYQWLRYAGESIVSALIFAGVVGVMSVLTIETALLIIARRNGKHFLFAFTLISLYILLVTYSMITSITAQYIGMISSQVAAEEVRATASRTSQTLTAIANEIESQKAHRAHITQSIQAIQKTIGELSIEKVAEYRTTYSRLAQEQAALREELNRVDEKIAALSKQQNEVSVKDVAIMSKDVYLIYERLFHIPSQVVQLLLIVFRAVVLDVVNAVAFWLLISDIWKPEAKTMPYKEAKGFIADTLAENGGEITNIVGVKEEYVEQILKLLRRRRVVRGNKIIPGKLNEAISILKETHE